MGKRIAWIDITKGLLIILVVLGHSSIQDLPAVVINSFHMSAFFVLAGITYRNENLVFKSFFIKKFRALLLPYLMFALILLLYFLCKKVLFEGYSFDFLSGLISIVVPVSGRTSTSVYGLWFFPCLFLAEIILYLLLWIYRITKKYFISILCYTFLCIICWQLHKLTNVVSIIDIAPIAVLYLGIGEIIQARLKQVEDNHVCIAILSVILFSICVVCNYQFAGSVFDLSSMNLGIWPIYILSGVFGTALICTISIGISRCKLLEDIGKDSMYYYGLHYEMIGVVEKIIKGGILQTIITVTVLYSIIFLFKRGKEIFIRDKK